MTPDELAARGLRVKAMDWQPHPNSLSPIEECAVADAPFNHRYQVQRDPWASSYMAFLHPRLPIVDSTLWWESKGHPNMTTARAAAYDDRAARVAAMIEVDE